MEFVVYCGNDKVGKTTMSRSLQLLLHRGCKRRTAIVSFSDALRDELVTLYDLPEEIVYNKSIDKNAVILEMKSFKVDVNIPELWLQQGLIESVSAFKDVVISLRELFVTHGSRIRRAIDPQYWAHRFNARIEDIRNECDLVIVDDAREPEDFDYFNDKIAHFFHLKNGHNGHTNKTQEVFNAWVKQHPERIDKKLKLPIPLLAYTADKINTEHVIPKVLPRKRAKPIW